MKKILIIGISLFCLNSYAAGKMTYRLQQFTNDKVTVWATTIYPNQNQKLKLHRHERDRIVVALQNGILKVQNDKGQFHYLKLEKGKAYYLKKDTPQELHTDENVGQRAVKVVVIELK